MRIRLSIVWGACVVLALVLPVQALAQTQAPASSTSSGQAPTTAPNDSRVDALQPDFNLAALPTTLRMPAGKAAFRVTHRFSRPLGRGDFGDLLNDFFGFDNGAQIGLEMRFGLMPGTQVGIHRTSGDKTIEIFGQQNLWQQRPDGHPLGIDVIATLEGLDNLKGQKSSALGLLVSRKVGRVAALYVEPIFVANTNPAETGDNNTTMIGLGARVRIRPATYLVGEVTPRVAGYKAPFHVDQGSFGIEMRAGGHLFQINFSNGFGTTLGQLATGGTSKSDWYIGFNISRKFF